MAKIDGGGDLYTGVLALEPFFERARGRRGRLPEPHVRTADGRPLPGFAMAKTAARARAGSGVSAGSGAGSARDRVATHVAMALRVAAGAPEVVVKVTGWNTQGRQVKAHLAYLGRDPDAHAELDGGERLHGRSGIMAAAALFDGPHTALGQAGNGALAVHVMFSMPAGTPSAALLDAARETAQKAFHGHDYVLVLHEDRAHHHVHAVVGARDESGRKLRHYKPDVQQWRERFAAALRARGVLAEATSRQFRGVTRRPVGRAVRAIRDGHRTDRAAGQPVRAMARTDAAKVQEAIARLAGSARPPTPWDPPIRAARADVEAGWRVFGALVEARGGQSGTDGHQLIAQFLEQMPPLRYERDRIEAAIQHLRKTRGREHSETDAVLRSPEPVESASHKRRR